MRIRGAQAKTIPQQNSAFEVLGGIEKRWASYQPWLKTIGYSLRRRYQPGWKASWLTSGIPERESEDSLVLNFRALVLDAIRDSDGRRVALKLVPTRTKELPIWQYLNSPERASDPRNHTVPLLAVHPLPDTDEHVLAVMPLLLYYDTLRFETLGELLSCLYHLVQGLAFLHEHNIAHLDMCDQNTMLDPGSGQTGLFPKGFHPVRALCYVPNPKSPRVASNDPHSCRTLAQVNYYIIDFGESVQFESFEAREYITGATGHDLDVPEFATNDPYDPFPLDIRATGDMLHTAFFKPSRGYQGLEFLKPIITEMQRDDPKERPSAMDVLSKVHSLLEEQTLTSLRTPLRGIQEDLGIDKDDARKHIYEARVKRYHPIQPPIPGLKTEEVEPMTLIAKILGRLRLLF
ncbi:hypothetical protein SISSUDRAFT_1043352 [Sistotremastrum suecicum HHB10207 ss-3]|uniref:Protein kinase domain-containing protein n=1 Tax=Sistotremastrum suecicum HHB10207 ss-3 TaxID=1314776 RepID=A0A166FW03_9AGAM|nr:hypothetical protein SISSUDRAFT_1043352 [Sistotremastrum suecicum HHB10207 ss-3]